MNLTEIESILQAAFIQCEAVLCPLTDQQKQILLQVVASSLTRESLISSANGNRDSQTANPLDELTPQQRQALLHFVKEQEKLERPWKIKLLNDWLHNRDSGAVQFIRDRYGPQWLNRVNSVHLRQYLEAETSSNELKLKVGDRIEVSNGLWEWVQDNGPCSREWFPCTVVRLSHRTDNDGSYHNGVIRFNNGTEYEIQGICEWNRYNWRYASD